MGSRSWVGGAARALGAAATKAARVTSKTTTRCFIVPFPPEDGCTADCDWASVDLWLGRHLRRGSSRPRSATGTGSVLRDGPESEVASATPSRTGRDGEASDAGSVGRRAPASRRRCCRRRCRHFLPSPPRPPPCHRCGQASACRIDGWSVQPETPLERQGTIVALKYGSKGHIRVIARRATQTTQEGERHRVRAMQSGCDPLHAIYGPAAP